MNEKNALPKVQNIVIEAKVTFDIDEVYEAMKALINEGLEAQLKEIDSGLMLEMTDDTEMSIDKDSGNLVISFGYCEGRR